MQEETVVFWIFSFIIAGGVVVIVSAMRYRAKIMEMAHRERLAMIERGMSPPAELGTAYQDRQSARGSRSMSLGIVIVALGFALALLIGFASREGEIAVGVGGAIAVIGFAFIVNAMVVHRPPKEDDFFTTPRPVLDRPVVPPPAERRDPPST